MNVGRIKAITWLASLGVGGWLGWTIYQYVEHQAELAQGVTQARQLEVLNSVEAPPPPQDDLVDSSRILEAFREMNWPGTPPKEKPAEVAGPAEDEPKYTPVADLLVVQSLVVYPDPKGSMAWVKYLDPALAAAAPDPEDQILRVGSSLPEPQDKITVAKIGVDGVTFHFPDGLDRKDEVVQPELYDSGQARIVSVGADGAIEPEPYQGGIPVTSQVSEFRPQETTLIGRDEYQVGTKDAAEIEQNYTEIIARDIGYRPYRNPRTGKVEGLEITKVRQGSLPAQHGIQNGEILKSINGHAVTGVSDAVTFVKKEAGTTDDWSAVFERNGREFTRTYHSPPR